MKWLSRGDYKPTNYNRMVLIWNIEDDEIELRWPQSLIGNEYHFWMYAPENPHHGDYKCTHTK